ncbi:MAG TPA: hypothetical protein VGD45_31340 [Steroidobacter sp.]|uniref:hypothetical protein n=1 Tax=Steroidobacter sp. TaxID=1978227 RepID=UPI002ED8FF0D
MSARSLTQLRDRWAEAWPEALAAWSRHVVLRAPRLCLDDREAKQEGLTDSFAMIRLADQSVVINLADIQRRGLDGYATEILAHEIGHHVLAPSNLTDHARSLSRIRLALPTLEAHAPMIANLFTDLVINDRLQRSAGLRLAEVFKKVNQGEKETGALWNLYLRTYELLWSLERGTLVESALSEQAEGDAWLAMRIVRHYARNWLEGAAKFAMLMLPYLAKDALGPSLARAWHDTRAAGAGGQPAGLAEADSGDSQPLVHPSRDPEITGDSSGSVTPAESKAAPALAPRNMPGGQTRQPFEYGEILRAAGVTLSDHDIAVAYYRERAAPHLIRFPARKRPAALDPLPEGIEPWQMGESFDTIDWLQTILQSPRIVPGMTTVQRVWGLSQGAEPASVPLNLDVFIDSSGSMPNPQQFMSFPTLAGAILCLSALRAGASVKVTVWSGKHEATSTPGFVRDTDLVMRTLISYYGGATQFPLPVLRETYLESQRPIPPTHLLFISDDGVTTLFDRDERGNSGWDLFRAALAKATGGATFVLNLMKEWDTGNFPFANRETLIRARDELDVSIYRIDDWEELVKFAREFAKRVYEPARSSAGAPA